MKKIFLVTVLTYFSTILLVQAQITDDFSDGNFTANPYWTGDSLQFKVNNEKLQLSGSGSDSSFLVTSIPFLQGNLEWNFELKLNFSPSSSNYSRIYLFSDERNLEAGLNGYFLQFGESGSNDAIELYRQSGNQIMNLGRGINAMLANGFQVRLKVKLDTLGNWEVLSNYNNLTLFNSEIQYHDSNISAANYFGWKCVYTSSNADKFYLDDFYFGMEILDTTPPLVQNLIVTDSMHIDLYFNERTDSASAINIQNYLINPSITISAITADSQNQLLYHFSISNSFTNGTEYMLTANGVSDLYNNSISNTSVKFNFIEFTESIQADIVITEIMADPGEAPSIPAVEYLEVYNRSAKYLSTAGWTISDGSSSGNIPSDTIFTGEFRTYCGSSDVILLESAGIKNVKGITSFPGLNNDGDDLRIYDKNNLLLDRVNYTAEFYHDDIKKNGGWSMERIDKNFTCSNSLNWKASNNTHGGTPSETNSVNGLFNDYINPYLMHGIIIDSTHIRLFFSEAMDSLSIQNISNYTIDNYTGNILVASVEEPDFSSVIIELSSLLKDKTIYTVKAASNLKDCAGNILKVFTSINLGFADTVKQGDIIINEILFNPKPDQYDFVELYNSSQKIIDLSKLKIANADLLNNETGTIESVSKEQHLIFPGNYIVVGNDINSISINYKVNDPRALLKTELPSYNDDEGIVRLFSSSIDLIDEFHYDEKMQFSLLNSAEGVSLEKINPYVSSSTKNNWHSAAQTAGYATPGYKNSQYFQSQEHEQLLKIEPELFSPGNDGESDIINFSIHTDKPGYYASLSIYNSQGIEQVKLADNELCGESASWSWNGFTSEQSIAPIGIYLAYLSLINSDGTILEEKRACVIGQHF